MTNGIMTAADMQDLLDGLQPGDRIRVIFKDMPVDAYRIQTFLLLCEQFSPGPATLRIDEMSVMNLIAVAQSGNWHGFRTYELTVLDGFDSKDFNYRTLRHDILESIEKL